jgi:hypothetical protein
VVFAGGVPLAPPQLWVALLNSRGGLSAFCSPRAFQLAEPRWQISLSRLPVGYGSIGYGQISDLPCVKGFGGFKTEIIRLRAIPCSPLRSRERMPSGPLLLDPQARELLS